MNSSCLVPSALSLVLLLQACDDSNPSGAGRDNVYTIPAGENAPTITVEEYRLQDALVCSDDLRKLDQQVVLLVHATTVDPKVNFDWNWIPALEALDLPFCTIELPKDGMGDIQVAAEYVVFAIQEIYQTTGHKVQIIGHSQGGLVPRWALRYWPYTREMVDDLVSFAAPNHGTVVLNTMCVQGCAAALWQQSADSNFINALNETFEVVPQVSYTSIFTYLDELVLPSIPAIGASSALIAGSSNVVNVATQEICPANTAEHLTLGTSDPVAYRLAIDALTHAGPADPSRIGLDVCLELFMPGVDPTSFAFDFTGGALMVIEQLALDDDVSEEPPLKCYVDDSCP
ncbi:MAG: lipase family alpha/beta hydrolase [Oceanococcus sp.]